MASQTGRSKSLADTLHLKEHLVIHGAEDVTYGSYRKSTGVKPNNNVQSGDNPYKCKTCGKAFADKASLKQHLLNHLAEDAKTPATKQPAKTQASIEATQATKEPAKKQTTEKHVKREATEERMKTSATEELAKKEDGEPTEDHVDATEKPYKCSICKKTFAAMEELIKDIMVHSEGKKQSAKSKAKRVEPLEYRFKCKICGKAFQHKKWLIEHTGIHRSVTFQCRTCELIFREKGDLTRHEATHTVDKANTPKNQVVAACSLCDAKFTEPSSLSNHIRLAHMSNYLTGGVMQLPNESESVEEPSWQYSGETLPAGGLLLTVKQEPGDFVDTIKEEPAADFIEIRPMPQDDGNEMVECNLCGKTFDHEQSYKFHVQEEHLFIADTSTQFTTEEETTNHTHNSGATTNDSSSQHDNDVDMAEQKTDDLDEENKHSYSCQCVACIKKFATKHNLKKYRKMHAKPIKPYTCGLCGKTFTVNYVLIRHMVRHAGKHLYMCGVCGRSYCRNNSLIIHMRMHTNLKQAGTTAFKVRERVLIRNEVKIPKTTIQRHTKRCTQSKDTSAAKTEGDKESIQAPCMLTLKCKECDQDFEQCIESTEEISTGVRQLREKCNKCEARDKWLSGKEEEGEVAQHLTTLTLECATCCRTFEKEIKVGDKIVDKTAQKCNICTASEKLLAEESTEPPPPPKKPTYVHQCNTCGKVFLLRRDLRRHENMYVAFSQFECCLCAEIFTKGSKFIAHKKTHTGEKPYRCSFCCREFVDVDEDFYILRMHLKAHNTDAIDKSVAEKRPLSRREKAHMSWNQTECSICKMTSVSQDALSKHVKIYHGLHMCKICGATFKTGALVLEHRGMHRGPDGKFHCKDCNRSYRSLEKLVQHREFCRQWNKPSNSGTASEGQPTTDNFDAVKIKAEKDDDIGNDTLFVCHACGMIFTSDESLQEHACTMTPGDAGADAMNIKTEDTDQSEADEGDTLTMDCIGCGLKFERDANSTDDVNSTHDNKEWRKCSICKARDKFFMQQNIMARKIGEKAFKCKTCKKAFRRRDEAEAHERTHVTPFTCNTCGKVFLRERSLQGHIRLHALEQGLAKNADKNIKGALPECKMCGMWFTNSPTLEGHMATVHGTGKTGKNREAQKDELKCKMCDAIFTSSEILTVHEKNCVASQSGVEYQMVKNKAMDDTTPETSFGCVICSMTFTSNAAFRDHMATHEVQDETMEDFQVKIERDDDSIEDGSSKEGESSGSEGTKYGGYSTLECHLCKLVFETQTELENHIEMHSTEEMASFTDGSTSEKHEALNIDDVENPFRCSICKKTFSYVYRLQAHIQTHVRTKEVELRKWPYQCDTCGRIFKKKDHLINHKKRHVQNCECTECGKTFMRKAELKRHMKTHSGE